MEYIEVQKRFPQTPIEMPLFINSVPKCGTMLLRNILLMFVPANQIHWPFVTNANVLDVLPAGEPKAFAGHLSRAPATSVLMRGVRHVLLVRDPRSYVLAHARFLFSEQMALTTTLGAYIREHRLSLDEVIPAVITGWMLPGDKMTNFPSVLDTFVGNALAWTDHAHVVKYEELMRALSDIGSDTASDYFGQLLSACGLQNTSDWEERVIAGADRGVSATASERLRIVNDRDYLTDREIALLNAVAPNLLHALDYAD